MDTPSANNSAPVSEPSRETAAGIGGRMAKGAAWMVGARFAMRAVGLVSTVILARLLMPADFGLVALAMIMVGLLDVMSEFSFDVVLIQNRQAGRAHYDTAWTLSIIRGFIVAGLMMALAGSSAAFFNEPRIEAIVYWLALVAFIKGFQNIGIVNFRKNLQFHKDFVFTLAVKLIGFVVVVSLAFAWRSYWALIAGNLAAAIVRVGLSYAMQGYRPRLSLAEWRGIMAFSKWLLANNFLDFIYSRSDTFVLAKLAGAQVVGLYTVAFEFSNMATSEVAAPIRRALFPGYAKLAGQPDALRASFIATFALIIAVAGPLAIGMLLVADPMVRVVLGANWVEAIPLIQVLALYGFLMVCMANSGPVYLALGRPHLLTVFIVVGLSIRLPLLVWGTMLAGAYGAAWAATTATAVSVAVNLWVIIRVLRLSVTDLLGATWRTAVALTCMAAVVRATELGWSAGNSFPEQLAVLAVLCALGAATYGVTHIGLWRLCGCPDGPERHIVATLRGAMRRIYPAAHARTAPGVSRK